MKKPIEPGSAIDRANPSRQPRTAAPHTRPRLREALNAVGGSANQTTRLNNTAMSYKPLSLIAVLVVAVRLGAQEVGEITQRTAPATAEKAISVLQDARKVVQKRLANIAAQADPLADAVATYRANPTPETALKLLHREAVVAGIGAKESEAIAAEAASVAKACAGLSAQTQAAAELLRPGLDKAARAQAENASTRNVGFTELREVHRSLVERGVTSETTMSAAEKRKVATLLRLAGAADLAERFLKMEVGATETVIARLNTLSEQFAARQRNFQDLSQAYQLHAGSFKTVGGSVARVAHLIEVNQRFDGEAKAAAELEGELARIDDVLGKTFDSLPDDFTPAFAPTDTGVLRKESTGLWSRFLRFIGIVEEPKPEVAQTGGATK